MFHLLRALKIRFSRPLFIPFKDDWKPNSLIFVFFFTLGLLFLPCAEAHLFVSDLVLPLFRGCTIQGTLYLTPLMLTWILLQYFTEPL